MYSKHICEIILLIIILSVFVKYSSKASCKIYILIPVSDTERAEKLSAPYCSNLVFNPFNLSSEATA